MNAVESSENKIAVVKTLTPYFWSRIFATGAPQCHPERSEGPLLMALKVPRFARDDTFFVSNVEGQPIMLRPPLS